MKKLFISFITFLACLQVGTAQQEEIRFRRLSPIDGLSQSSVMDMVQDKSGFLWLATQDGLNRYDGYVFKYYEKYFQDITAQKYSRLGKLATDQANDLWMITNGGKLQRRDHLTGKFSAYEQVKRANCLFTDAKGNVWIGTLGNGIYRFSVDSKRFSFLPAQEDIYDFDETPEHTLLVASGHNILEINIRDNRARCHRFQAGSGVGFSSVKKDRAGNIWAGSHSGGLFYKRRGEPVFTKFTGFSVGDRLPENLYTLDLHIDKYGRIWVGTYGRGLLVIDPQKKRIRQFTLNDKDPNSVSYNDILRIYEDNTGVIWLGTDGGSVSYYDEHNILFNVITKEQVPPNIEIQQIRAIHEDAGRHLWLGTSGKGLTVNDTKKNTWKTYRHDSLNNKSISNDRVLALMSDVQTGLLWVGTQGGGLNFFSPETGHFRVAKQLPDLVIKCLFTDKSGNQWVGTQQSGLCRFDSDKGLIRQFIPANSSINSADIKAIVQGEGDDLWIAHESAGLNLFNPKTSRFSTFRHEDANPGSLISDEIKCLYYDQQKKTLWIGTKGNGMDAFDGNKFHHFTTKNGLPNNMVYGILPDQDQNLWLSTNKGISLFVPTKNLNSDEKPDVINYQEKDGLQYPEFNTGAYFKNAAKTLFFGGIKGINWFHPPQKSAQKERTPTMMITRISVFGKPIETDSTIENKNLISLKFDQNAIRIEFAHAALTAKKNYQYRLNGFSKWTDSQTNFAEFNNLTPGKYVFEIRLKGAEEVLRSLVIRITPPFWQTWWFRLNTLCLVSVLLYLFYRDQLARRTLKYKLISNEAVIRQSEAELLEKEAVFKQKIAETEVAALRSQMNPHFIFNCLNSIKYYSLENDSKAASEYLTKFSRLIRLVLENSRSEKVTLENELETLRLYGEMEVMRFKDKVRIDLQVAPEIDQLFIELPPLLLQPFMENAVWHGLMHKEEGGTVHIEVTQPADDMLHIEITDDGIGRKRASELKSKTAMVNKSFGMKLTSERIALINQIYKIDTRVQIRDLYGMDGSPSGTKVILDIPV